MQKLNKSFVGVQGAVFPPGRGDLYAEMLEEYVSYILPHQSIFNRLPAPRGPLAAGGKKWKIA